MTTVDTIARVRRAFYVQGWPLKRINHELHLSRNTVREILRSEETAFGYERASPSRKSGHGGNSLTPCLSGNCGKAAREQLTLMCVFEELRALGYEGGYDATRRYAKSWAKAQSSSAGEAYVPLFFAAGRGLPVRLEWTRLSQTSVGCLARG